MDNWNVTQAIFPNRRQFTSADVKVLVLIFVTPSDEENENALLDFNNKQHFTMIVELRVSKL